MARKKATKKGRADGLGPGGKVHSRKIGGHTYQRFPVRFGSKRDATSNAAAFRQLSNKPSVRVVKEAGRHSVYISGTAPSRTKRRKKKKR